VPDVKRLISQVAAENGIRVEPDDPLFALVTINRMVLDEAIQKLQGQIQARIAEFNADMERAERLAGGILAQKVRESAEQMATVRKTTFTWRAWRLGSLCIWCTRRIAARY